MIDMNLSHPVIWVVGFVAAVALPIAILRSAQWIILRAGEERLQAIPFSIWQPLYEKFLRLSHQCLYGLSLKLPRHDLYKAMNPERCTQQTLKVLIPYTESLTDQLIQPLSPVIWDNMPQAMRMPIYHRVTTKFRPCIDKLIEYLDFIVCDLFDHDKFVYQELSKQETGYRFISTEALHQYWSNLSKSSIKLSCFCIIFYFLACLIAPKLASMTILLVLPIICTGIVTFYTQPLTKSMQAGFARCLGYWLGEKIYLMDQFINKMRNGGCPPTELQGVINKAFQPLIEDLPLKTLAQFGLGRQAPLDLRANLINYVILNASTPFEHSQFRQERALELSAAFEEALKETALNEIQLALKPIHQLLLKIIWSVTVSFGIVIALTLCFI
ncbi:MAG: hypothetical protein VX185_16945 [Pseudomonadota bacterium]|nr:hypothetical protein [Gammaproteobacteria bacterium]MEC8012444.1 hypothetical protein [Pseudomonadota bacterium]HBF07774.1 hypothetical protein [Gammaproteobacteria bacterium]|tara:strand:+ start:25119 stop:26273 length:1155 start_codon:yes stop_codon:yes gene_type:complete